MARPPDTEFKGVLIALAGPVFGLLAAAALLRCRRPDRRSGLAGRRLRHRRHQPAEPGAGAAARRLQGARPGAGADPSAGWSAPRWWCVGAAAALLDLQPRHHAVRRCSSASALCASLARPLRPAARPLSWRRMARSASALYAASPLRALRRRCWRRGRARSSRHVHCLGGRTMTDRERLRRRPDHRRGPGRPLGRARRRAAQGAGAHRRAAAAGLLLGLGAGRHGRGAAADDDARRCTPPTPSPPAPGLVDPARPRHPHPRGPGGRAPPGRARRALRPRRGRRLRPEPGGRPLPRPRRPGRAATGPAAAIMRAVTAAAMAAPHIEIRANARVRALLHRRRRPGARRAGRARAARLTEIVAPATVLATGGLGGLYAVTTNPPRGARRGPGPGGAGRRARSPTPSSSSSTRPPSTSARDPAPLATEALRGEGARAGRRRRRAVHGPLPSARRPGAARRRRPRHRIEQRAGRGAFLDAREAIGERFPDEFPGRLRRLHGRRASIRASSRSRSRRRRTTTWAGSRPTPTGATSARRASSPPASAPRPACTAPTAWRPTRCWRRRCSGPAPARAAARGGRSGDRARCPPRPRPTCRDAALADPAPGDEPRRRRGARRARASRALLGLDRRAGGRATAAPCRSSPPAWSPQPRARRARESRGAHFRADFPRPRRGRRARSLHPRSPDAAAAAAAAAAAE